MMDVIVALFVCVFFIWLSYKVLKFVFVMAKKAIGWIGPYIVATVPGIATYIVTQSIFGVGVSEASWAGLATAAVLGTVMGSAG